LALACSSAAPPAEVPTVASAPAAAEAGSTTAEAPLDLTPVPAPKDIVARGTWRVPAQTVDAIAGWMQPGLDWRALTAGPLEELNGVVDFNAPVDLVATLSSATDKPRAQVAVAVGVSSQQAALDAFKSRGGPVEFVEPGVYSVQLGPRTPCFVAASLGPSRARLICSENREALEVLAPYLARGVPSKTALPNNLSLEVLAEPLWQRFGQKAEMLRSWLPLMVGELQLGSEALAASLNVAARALADEALLFASDLSRLSLTLEVRPEREALELAVATDYHAARSWLARGAVSGAARASVAPEQFWPLPADAGSAAYTAASDPAQSQALVRFSAELSDAALRYIGANAAERDAWVGILNKLNQLEGPWVSARGAVPQEMMQKPVDARELARLRMGYQLLGVKDDADLVGPLLERSLRLYNDAALRKGLSQRYGVEAAKLPKVTEKRSTQGKASVRTYEIAVPAQLYDVSVPGASGGGAAPAQGKAAAPIPLLLVCVHAAPWTWIGISSYDKLLDQKLRPLYDASARGATLQGRTGLDKLKTERANWAGFVSFGELATAYPVEENDTAWELLASLPNHGETPVVFQGNTSTEGPRADLTFNFPKGVFQDLGALIFR
jgi:hypothetical protein